MDGGGKGVEGSARCRRQQHGLPSPHPGELGGRGGGGRGEGSSQLRNPRCCRERGRDFADTGEPRGPLPASPQLTVDVRALMFLHLHQGERGSDHGPFAAASPIQDFPGVAVSQISRQPFAQQGHAAGLKAERHPSSAAAAVVIPGVGRVTEFLREGPPALDVAPVSAGFLGPMADPLAEGLDGRTVDAPLGDAELPEMRPGVAGQGFAVLEVEAAELAAGFAGWGGEENAPRRGAERGTRAPSWFSPPATLGAPLLCAESNPQNSRRSPAPGAGRLHRSRSVWIGGSHDPKFPLSSFRSPTSQNPLPTQGGVPRAHPPARRRLRGASPPLPRVPDSHVCAGLSCTGLVLKGSSVWMYALCLTSA